MSSSVQIAERFAEIAKILETEEDLQAFRRHLEEVLRGEAFRGSNRSGQFLRHVVEQSIAGHADALKERMIGIELFGRPPSYDTGEDAIVRVTASDVRKRLLQHYGAYRNVSEFRINLPLGSYIPEILRDPVQVTAMLEHTIEEFAVPAPLVNTMVADGETRSRGDSMPWQRLMLPVLILLLCLNIGLWSYFMLWGAKRESSGYRKDAMWSMLFQSSLPTQLITSDPNIAEIQGLTGQLLGLSDYANRRFIPDPTKVDPRILQLSDQVLRGDKAAAVDARVAAWVAQTSRNPLKVTAARELRLSDLLADGNFILLGSARSNPWTLFYNDLLDFRIVLDSSAHQEVVQNVHPHSGEPTAYIPSAKGYATGQSFATVSYVKNPDHGGNVLLLAGANAERTEAAGKLVTDSAALSAALQRCSVPTTLPIPSFQLLLRLSTMAGSPRHFDVVACHVLPQ